MPPNSTTLLVGGPDAGKTNYLGRIWLTITNQKGLVLRNGLPNDVDYLEAIASHLLKGNFAPHSLHGLKKECVIPVKVRDASPLDGEFIVPDCAGEEWMGIYKKREWTEDWEARISENCSCLLFIRASSSEIVTPMDWIGFFKCFGTTHAPAGALREGNAEHVTPTQVVLIDWLQFLRIAFSDKLGVACRPRIGIIVSAWDRVPSDDQNTSPSKYIEDNFPLLHQFLLTNTKYYDFRTFGCSVSGGDLHEEHGFRKSYLHRGPQNAGYIVYEHGGSIKRSTDHTLPLAWAMGRKLT